MKDKVEEMPVVPPKTVAQKIIAKWGITTIADNDYHSNTSHTTSYNGIASDYLDFRNYGKIYAQIMPFGKDIFSTIPLKYFKSTITLAK